MIHSRLLTASEMESNQVPNWVNTAFENFRIGRAKTLLSSYFNQSEDFCYSYLSHSDWSKLPRTIANFIMQMQETSSTYSKLFVFVEPEEKKQSVEYYGRYFEDVLRYLQVHGEMKCTTEVKRGLEIEFCSNLSEESIIICANTPSCKEGSKIDLRGSMVISFQLGETIEGRDARNSVTSSV